MTPHNNQDHKLNDGKSAKFHALLDTLLEPALVLMLLSLVLVVLWQVFSRYVLQSPSTVTDELARFLLIWLTLLGAAWVVGQRGHLAIDLLSEKLSIKRAVLLQGFLVLLMAAFALGVLVVGGLRLVDVTLTLAQRSTVLEVPMGYIYLALPISGVFMLGYCACAFVRAASYLKER
ncbi:TRAP transporter small permease [Glaciecola siphonariae]|uniref:TRAP transporter small permease protein n=1 Tax=Glaciecola siphonariae TaxID=521012 RepID=A0ABV9LWW6_9ALTE